MSITGGAERGVTKTRVLHEKSKSDAVQIDSTLCQAKRKKFLSHCLGILRQRREKPLTPSNIYL